MASLNIKCGLLLFLSCAIFWWRDVIRESTFEGYHTKAVQKGLKIGMLLFILSEIKNVNFRIIFR